MDQSTRNVSENFMEMAKEIQRRDLTRGGTVRGNLTVTGTLTQSGGAGASLTASQTFTGTTTFNGAVQFNGTTTFRAQTSFNGLTSSNTSVFNSTISFSGLGGAASQVNQAVTYKMKSIDGATQNSTCIVIVRADANSNTGLLTFTSTTTLAEEGAIGVLMQDSCTPGSVCDVAMFGPVRIACETGVTAGLHSPCTSGTRCQGDNCTAGTRGTSGFYLTSDSGNLCVAFLGAK